MNEIGKWWAKLPESTKRALKTLWQTFVGTFLAVFASGLTNGLIGFDAVGSLALSALSAAIAAVASKVVNLSKDVVEDDGQ